MNSSVRLPSHKWLTPFVVIGLIIGLFAAAPLPSFAQGPDCSQDTVVALSVGQYTDQEMADDHSLHTQLSTAIEAATSALQTCGDTDKRAAIKVTKTATNLSLPGVISDKNYGEVLIVGEADAEPIVGHAGKQVVTNTALAIENISFDLAANYFHPQANFSCKKCDVFGRGDGLSFIKGDDSMPQVEKIAVSESTFHNASIATGDLLANHLLITGNKARDDRDGPQPFINLDPVVSPDLKTEIINNTFTFEGRDREGKMIILQRPNVLIDHNLFDTDNIQQGEGIYINTVGAGGAAAYQLIDHVDIRMNTFKLRRSIGNSMPDGPPTDELGVITFHYNDLSFSPETLPKQDTFMDHTKTYGPCNFWGDLAKREDVKANRPSMDRYLKAAPTAFGQGCGDDTPPPAPTPPASPSPTPTPDSGDDDDRFGKEDRVRTAVDISTNQFPKGAEGVIIARADDAADSVSAVPFAKYMDMPILLTYPNTLHPDVAKEVKRLMPKGGKVYIMGREVAITPGVEADLKKLAGETTRIAGENRAATAVESAKVLKAKDKLKHIVVADGSDWQPDLIAGPAAAITEGATLLTWGETVAPETAAYLRDHANVPVTAIGAKASKAGLAKDNLTASDPTELSLQVIDKFFTNPKVVGFATSDDFADALTGGAHMAGLRGPLILIGHKTPDKVTKWVKDTKSLQRLVIYGGTERIAAEQEAALRTALKH